VRRILVGITAVLLLSSCSAQPTASALPAPSAGGSPAIAPPSLPASASASPSSSTSAPAPHKCAIFPADNVWHADVSTLPVNGKSSAWVATIGSATHAHPDFGAGFGIPITAVPAGQATTKVRFDYADESDKGGYPIPKNVKIEDGGDAHIILFDSTACKDFELYAAHRNGDGSWQAGSGAIYDLRSDALRKAGFTSADAAGLPILPGLVRYDEVAAGHVDHAIRFTVPRSRNAFIWPARHAASSSSDAALPPMGARFRLKSTVDTSRMSKPARVIAEAMKRYGLILADNGSSWFFSGADDSRWNNEALDDLKSLIGSDFEAVETSGLIADPNSGRCK
jgi:Prokaryotic membrane lipoprotein lipid attachment site